MLLAMLSKNYRSPNNFTNGYGALNCKNLKILNRFGAAKISIGYTEEYTVSCVSNFIKNARFHMY